VTHFPDQLVVPRRFCGPPDSGNGGWCSGLFSALAPAGGVPEVTLRMPPPLEVALNVVEETVRTPSGDLVASVQAVPAFDFDGRPVGWDDAVAASRSYAGFTDHPFLTCYVCGPARTDGLRIFPGPLADGGVAAPFAVPADVSPNTVWAALDCPGGWSVISPGRPYVLGRMAAVVSAVPAPGDECVVTGVCDGVEGRKAAVRTALWSVDGTLLAHARATWIAI
jgi:hypothetical protein